MELGKYLAIRLQGQPARATPHHAFGPINNNTPPTTANTPASAAGTNIAQNPIHGWSERSACIK